MSRTSRILLALAAAALAAFFLVERPGRRAADRREEQAARLPVVDAGAVDALTIARRSDTIALVLRDGRWRMTAPIADLADPNAVKSLLDAIQTASVQRNLGPVDDRHPFGLDAPEATIVLAAGSDTLLQVDVGAATVDRAWAYARVGTPDVLLISTDVRRAATLPVDGYRNPRVVEFALDDVVSYRLRTRTHSTAWTRGRNGWFAVENRDTVAGDSVAVEDVLRRLRGLRAAGFVAPGDTAGSFRRVDCAVAVHTRDGAPMTIHFARSAGGTWFASNDAEPRVVTLADSVDDLLVRTTTTLRDRRLLQFFPPDAIQVEIAAPGISETLVRVAGVWAYPNPALGRIDPERAADLVRTMRALKWTDVPATAPGQPADAPGFSVVVRGANGTILDEMTAWLRPGETRWRVTSRSSPGSWLIDASGLDALLDRVRQLRPR